MNYLIKEGGFSAFKIPASNVVFRALLFISTPEQPTPGRIVSVSEILFYLFRLRQVLVVACRLFSCGMHTLSCSMWALSCGIHVGSSSPARDQTQAPCIGSAVSYPPDHQGSPLRF